VAWSWRITATCLRNTSGLLELKKRIAAAKIPSSQLDETINVATWNIREFGKHARSEPAIHYIAEIIGQFDLVGAIEVREDLSDLRRVLNILGSYWRAVYSDVITDPGGNKERTAFLYDRRAVSFNGLAAEVDPLRVKVGTEYLASLSFWRAPHTCSFRAGNFDYFYGDACPLGRQRRGQARGTPTTGRGSTHVSRTVGIEDYDLIVMGDFNVPKVDDAVQGPHEPRAANPDGAEDPEGRRPGDGGSNQMDMRA
jgi:hypothetical protein